MQKIKKKMCIEIVPMFVCVRRGVCYILRTSTLINGQSIIVFCPKADLSQQTRHSPLYPFLSLSFRIFIQYIYHNIVYPLISSALNFVPVYHSF